MTEVNEEKLLAAIAALNVLTTPDGKALVCADEKLAAKYLGGWDGELVMCRPVEIRIRLSEKPDKTAKKHNAEINCCIDGVPVFTTSDTYPLLPDRATHVISHLNEYLLTGIQLGFCEAEALTHLCEDDDKKIVSQLKDHLETVLEESKDRLRILPGKRLNRVRRALKRANILRSYELLYEICRPIKAYHDQSYKEFRRRENRRTREEWRAVWRKSAQMIYPDLPQHLLDYFSLPDGYSVSEITKAALADSYNYSRSYIDKLLNIARKEKDTHPYYKIVTRSKDRPRTLFV